MENRKIMVNIQNVVTRLPELRFEEPLNWIIEEGQQWAVIGPNGAGKTLIADVMQRKFALKEGEVTFGYEGNVSNLVKSIAFKDIYSLADCRNSYYQQRWHSTETDEVPTIEDILKEDAGSEDYHKVLSLFGIEELLPKKLIFLSSGELRKFLIVRTLLKRPRVLILDNPFIGLDAKTRDQLHALLCELIRMTCLQVILVLSKTDDIPSLITHVIPVENRMCGDKITLKAYLAGCKPVPERVLSKEKEERILALPYGDGFYHTDHVVDLNKVSIRYGERTILKELDWSVKCGEKWALSGDNGSGKSTLLSLVCADNPQSYACDITLFGRKRGSGESIWEIKKHIGYVSPEMHRAYLKNLPAIDIVASGLHDSVGLYKRPRPEQMETCEWWMDIFGIADLKERSFLQLSSGEQRLVLLARAFVKDPELLILDEPLHGLDLINRRLVKDIIETFCRRRDKTMIMVTHYKDELPMCITGSLHLKRNE